MALLLYSVTRIESFSLSICNDVDIYGNIDGDLRVSSQTGSRVNIYGNVGEQGGLRFASASDDNSTTEKEKIAGIVLQSGDSLVKHFRLENYEMALFSSHQSPDGVTTYSLT